ncbi:MAG TPA: glycosyltransferase family 2 protein [Catalimonadaceae bacterium]|nr:glycosyltransferase family 2 protein [Catalimonadaceae bacterium]
MALFFFLTMLKGGKWTRSEFREDTDENPLVSVITVTFNAQLHLAQALDSILNQTYSNVELILIDGGSTDQTLNIIKERDHLIDFWQSEPDAGIYDAMNKGLKLARGRWIAFKNADDWFLPDAIQKFVDCSKNQPGDVYCGHSLSIIQEEPLVTAPFFTNANRIGQIPGIDHRSCFVRTAMHKLIPFDTTYRLAADLDVFWRLKKAGGAFIQMNEFMSYKRFGGASDGNIILSECFRINRKNQGATFAIKTWLSFQAKYYFWKSGNYFLKLLLGDQGYNRFKSRKLR